MTDDNLAREAIRAGLLVKASPDAARAVFSSAIELVDDISDDLAREMWSFLYGFAEMLPVAVDSASALFATTIKRAAPTPHDKRGAIKAALSQVFGARSLSSNDGNQG